MKPLIYTYISETKVDMLFKQLVSKNSHLLKVNTKFSFPGVEASVGLENKDKQVEIFSKTQRLIHHMNKKEMIINLKGSIGKIGVGDFFQDTDEWHTGLLAFNNHSTENENNQKPSGAFINFKIHGDQLILLVGSSSHIIDSRRTTHIDNFNLFSNEYSTTELLLDLSKIVKTLVNNDNSGDWTRTLEFPPHLATQLLLGHLSLKRFLDYPTSNAHIVYKIYRTVNLREIARKLSVQIKNSTDRELVKEKLTETGMLRFSHLHIGSPIFVAVS